MVYFISFVQFEMCFEEKGKGVIWEEFVFKKSYINELQI